NPAYARNMGLRISKGEYIAFCDSDDFFEPNKLEKQIGLLEKNSHIAVSYSDFTIIDENGKFINEIKVPEWDRKKWMRNRFITFSTVVIRRKVIKEIGGFNPYWDACDDFDFLIRASSRFNFMRYPESLLKFTKHSKSLNTNIPKVKMNNNLIERIYKIKPFITFFKDQFYWKLISIFYYNTLRDKLPEKKRKLSYLKRFIGSSTR
ncbi:MAG: glycosyltransferase, partial [Candidatus Helarchaeota archaeon]